MSYISPFQEGMIFDTHAHYDDDAFDADRERLLKSLKYSVCGIINCACNSASAKTTLELAHKYPFVYAAVGLHPEDTEPLDFAWIEAAATDEKCVAIGEIGLDYHWDSVPRDVQKYNFISQLKLAQKLGKPVIIHSRDANADTFDIIKKHRPKGVMHCYSGSAEMARQLVDMGIYIGLGGVLTFKNARKTVEVAEQIPLEYILLETDAPYMAPVPLRSKRCHSGMIINVARRLAEIKGISVAEVLNTTRENTRRLFGV